MIELALVSGREARAFFYEDDQWFALSSDGKHPAYPLAVRSAVNGPGEFEIVNPANEVELLEILNQRKRFADGLFVTLASIDPEISISTRVLLAQQAEDHLSDSEVYAFVLNRILSWPLPAGIIGCRHNLMEVAQSFDRVREALHQIFEAQPLLQELIHRWEDAASEIGIPPSELSALRSELIAEDFFSAILRTLRQENASRVNSMIVAELLKPERDMRQSAMLLEFQKRVQAICLRRFAEKQPSPRSARRLHRV
jgi:hypothetical protein